MALKYFQCFLDEITEVFTLPLTVVDAVARIHWNIKHRISSLTITACVPKTELSNSLQLRKLSRWFSTAVVGKSQFWMMSSKRHTLLEFQKKSEHLNLTSGYIAEDRRSHVLTKKTALKMKRPFCTLEGTCGLFIFSAVFFVSTWDRRCKRDFLSRPRPRFHFVSRPRPRLFMQHQMENNTSTQNVYMPSTAITRKTRSSATA